MRKFYTTLFLALVYTMATFAQGLPNGGQTLPYYGKQMKASKYSVMKAPMLAGEVLITPPETAVIEENWSIEGNYINNSNPYANSNTIKVAFDGNDVYIQGMVFLCPDAWIMGTINKGVATFANGQYAGTYGSSSIYACGSNDGSTVGDITFEYDDVAKTFTLTNYYIENTSVDSFSFYFYSYDIVISKAAEEIPAPTNVTAEPTATTADVAWTEAGTATQWNLRYREYIAPDKANRFWDFEDIDQLDDWFIIDNDEDGFCWEYANSRYTTHSGDGVLISASYDGDQGALTPDNWLVTPVVPFGGKVSFWACGQDASYAAEVFAVYVCMGGDDSLDEIYAISDDITATGEMTQYEFDLSDLEGMEGRIAIRHYNVTDMFYLNIDDVKVEIPGGIDVPEWNDVVGLSDSQYTIEDLTPETTYEVQVQAYGEAVISAWTESTIFTTLAETEIIVTVSEGATDGEYNYATMFYGDKNLSVPEVIKAYTATVANGEITLHEISGAIPAGTAVVLRTDSKLRETTDFEFSIVDEAEDIEADNMLKGSDEATTVSGNGFKYYMLSLNGDSEPGSIGFYFDKESNGGIQLKNGAHKAYLAVPEVEAAKGYPFGGDATGIEGLNVNDNDNVNEVYDLQGRRVVRPAKGIYIVNGKKIVVK